MSSQKRKTCFVTVLLSNGNPKDIPRRVLTPIGVARLGIQPTTCHNGVTIHHRTARPIAHPWNQNRLQKQRCNLGHTPVMPGIKSPNLPTVHSKNTTEEWINTVSISGFLCRPQYYSSTHLRPATLQATSGRVDSRLTAR